MFWTCHAVLPLMCSINTVRVLQYKYIKCKLCLTLELRFLNCKIFESRNNIKYFFISDYQDLLYKVVHSINCIYIAVTLDHLQYNIINL